MLSALFKGSDGFCIVSYSHTMCILGFFDSTLTTSRLSSGGMCSSKARGLTCSFGLEWIAIDEEISVTAVGRCLYHKVPVVIPTAKPIAAAIRMKIRGQVIVLTLFAGSLAIRSATPPSLKRSLASFCCK